MPKGRVGSIFPLDLREKRKAREWSRADLAAKLGVVPGYVAKLETGYRDISFPLALECAKIFGSITVDYAGERFVVGPQGMAPEPPRGEAIDAGMAKDELIGAAHAAADSMLAYSTAIRAGMRGNTGMLARLVSVARDLAQSASAFEVSLATQYPKFAGKAIAEGHALPRHWEATTDVAA